MPRTVTTTQTLYKFGELSEDAKEKARQWYREADDGDNFWSESVIEDAATIADLMGIDLRQRPVKLMNGSTRYEPAIYWSGFWSQGDGASFEGTYTYKKGSAKAVREHAPKDEALHAIAQGLADLQRLNFYGIEAKLERGGGSNFYSHEMTISIDVFTKNDQYNEPACADEVREYLRDYMRWIYRQLEKEYEYQNSDEVVDENIIANGYEFNEDGRTS